MKEKETAIKVDPFSTPSKEQFKQIMDSALEDFWARVAKQLPQCRSGDLSPTMTLELEIVAEKAIIEWWNNNCPDLTC